MFGSPSYQIVTWCMSSMIKNQDTDKILKALNSDEQRKKLLEGFEYRRNNKLPIEADIMYKEALDIAKKYPAS